MEYTLHQLRILVKVSEMQSITKAAEELFLTQPAVSIQLKKLQEQHDFLQGRVGEFVRPVGKLFHEGIVIVGPAFQHRVGQFMLILKVMKERRLGEAGGVHDVGQRRAAETLAKQQVFGRQDDAFSG